MYKGLISNFLNIRTIALIVTYTIILLVCYWLSYELRFDFAVTEKYSQVRFETIWWVLLLKLCLLFGFGQVDSLLAYFRLPDALRLFAALFISALFLLLLWFQFGGNKVAPRSVILSDLQLSFLSIAGFRLIFRLAYSKNLSDWFVSGDQERVVIIGAGEVGTGLCSELMSKRSLGMSPVAFIDDDPKKIGRYIHGIKVAQSVNAIEAVAKKYNASRAIIAFPSASIKRVRQVAEIAGKANLQVDIVPALTDLVNGRAQLSELRPIQLEDLLGREAVDLNTDAIHGLLTGKRILVTGAGGSIGSELVRQIGNEAPAALLCIDQAELAIFNLRQLMSSESSVALSIETKVLDICDTEQIRAAIEAFKPEIIFHAAAHKHVNLMESQPNEAIKNNSIGTFMLAHLASEFEVEKFVLISTDKAINPTNVMGASKRIAELGMLSAQMKPENKTRFMAVRFGNVLGSSGSVIPIFRKQIAAGGPVTVTDPEVTRFFMTVEESVGLVLQSATLGEGGEIFVLDMGDAVRIIDVAKQMIALSGMREGEDIEIEIIGLRPGEKKYEEVQHVSEVLHHTSHKRILRFVGSNSSATAEALEAQLNAILLEKNSATSKALINKLVPEYVPHF